MPRPSWYKPGDGRDFVVSEEPYYDDERGIAPVTPSLGEDWVITEHGKRHAHRVGKAGYVVAKSGNGKIGVHKECATTYASQESCPRTCPLLGHGCYGEGGNVMMSALELNESCKSEWDCAVDEGKAISELAEFGVPGMKSYKLPPLRIHTVGDCRTLKSAKHVAIAADYYIEQYAKQPKSPIEMLDGSVPVWTYTHAWNIPRSAWGNMSILKSCNTVGEVARANSGGERWACSLVVPYHGKEDDVLPIDRFARLKTAPAACHGVQFKYIMCKAQLKPKDKNEACSTCQLCWQEKHLLRKFAPRVPVICFYTHGADKNKADDLANVVFSC
jgi:hypothetical protein